MNTEVIGNQEIMENAELQGLFDDLQRQAPGEIETQPIGRYGRMAMEYLHEIDPQRFSSLKMQGELTALMARVDEEARTKLLDITAKLLEQDPMPETDDTLERARHLNEKRGIAEEIVMNSARVLICRIN